MQRSRCSVVPMRTPPSMAARPGDDELQCYLDLMRSTTFFQILAFLPLRRHRARTWFVERGSITYMMCFKRRGFPSDDPDRPKPLVLSAICSISFPVGVVLVTSSFTWTRCQQKDSFFTLSVSILWLTRSLAT